MQRRLQLLRLLLRVLAVRRCGIVSAATATRAPIVGLLSPVQPALLLLLLPLEVRRVDVRVVLHGCELLGVDAGEEIWRMLRAPAAAVLLQVGAVPGGAAYLVVLLQLLIAKRGVAGQRRTGAPTAGDQVAFRAGCRRVGRGGGGISYRLCCSWRLK